MPSSKTGRTVCRPLEQDGQDGVSSCPKTGRKACPPALEREGAWTGPGLSSRRARVLLPSSVRALGQGGGGLAFEQDGQDCVSSCPHWKGRYGASVVAAATCVLPSGDRCSDMCSVCLLLVFHFARSLMLVLRFVLLRELTLRPLGACPPRSASLGSPSLAALSPNFNHYLCCSARLYVSRGLCCTRSASSSLSRSAPTPPPLPFLRLRRRSPPLPCRVSQAFSTAPSLGCVLGRVWSP